MLLYAAKNRMLMRNLSTVHLAARNPAMSNLLQKSKQICRAAFHQSEETPLPLSSIIALKSLEYKENNRNINGDDGEFCRMR